MTPGKYSLEKNSLSGEIPIYKQMSGADIKGHYYFFVQ
jgi:hypothetical protein